MRLIVGRRCGSHQAKTRGIPWTTVGLWDDWETPKSKDFVMRIERFYKTRFALSVDSAAKRPMLP
jgi:hypothetical protein